MLLSIGMMVKDEEKYLDKCLSAMKPLLDNLEAELVIVDTGSTDKTVEIAKKYTNKVYFHEWNNDFAQMRNIVLSYCIGEWFLFIDADEIIENCINLIEFFNSRKYMEFNSATINIKSITTGNNYVIFSPARLFKKDRDFKFSGAIHEQPLTRAPIEYLNVTCIHYGYMTNDKELAEKKFNRNITLLKETLSKDPDNIYYLYQAATSYSVHANHNEAINYMKKAYDLAQKRPNKTEYIYVYQSICIEYYNIGDYISLEKHALESLKVKNDFIDFYFLLGLAQANLGKNNEAINALNKYLELYYNFDNLEKNVMFSYYSLNFINEVYYNLIDLYIKEQNYINAISVLIRADENKGSLQVLHKNLIDGIVNSNNHKLLLDYENELIKSNREKQLNEFYIILENYKLSASDDNITLMEEAFSNGVSVYSTLNKLRMEFRKNNSIDLSNYKEFISHIDLSKENNYYGDFIYILLAIRYDMAKVLSNCNFNKISSYFQYISEKYENTSEIIYEYITNTAIKDKFIYIRFYKELLHYLIILEGLDKEKMEKIYNLYIEYGFKYLHLVYTDFIINMACINDVKNEEEGFLLLLNKAFRYKDNNIRLYIKALKEALEILNPMKNLIEFLLNQIE
ncbi:MULTISPECIES: glycosyltransferase [unclassified Clostridium]|uniref:glycosyltransferase n=1 Tax=unclassified Clostridium TaxID=2614128 RepID=UPI0002976BDF|nr:MULTISPECIES: glycosyltransferase [unclassified Clostridium]EKQ51101.1 MAG: Glycosyl transferase family 2 [Clostridium sp. Maddingley MBC34-26]